MSKVKKVLKDKINSVHNRYKAFAYEYLNNNFNGSAAYCKVYGVSPDVGKAEAARLLAKTSSSFTAATMSKKAELIFLSAKTSSLDLIGPFSKIRPSEALYAQMAETRDFWLEVRL